MIGLLAVFAQLEREQIKERTWMGRVARAKTGLYHGGGHIPIGYEYSDGKLVINPYEAEQVKKIYEWYLSGSSLKAITDRLQDEGYTNKYSSYNSWSSVRNILGNETYTGRLHFGDIVVENAHEAIISDEQYKAAQVLRGKKQELYGPAFQSKHMLTGLMFCGKCGGRYYLRNSGKYSYYACYSRTKQMKNMIKDPNCMNKIWKAPELDALVDSKIRELLQSPKMAAELAASRPKKTPAVSSNANIEKRIRDIDKQISKLMELYQMDDIPAELLGGKINKLYGERTALQETLLPDEEPSAIPFDLVKELIADAAQIWDYADELQKRRILQSLISKIVITEDDVEIEWAF